MPVGLLVLVGSLTNIVLIRSDKVSCLLAFIVNPASIRCMPDCQHPTHSGLTSAKARERRTDLC